MVVLLKYLQIFVLGAFLVYGLSCSPSLSWVAAAHSPQDTVVVDLPGTGPRVVDSTSGKERWSVESGDGVPGFVVATSGILYASMSASHGGGTDVYAVHAGFGKAELVEHLPGVVVVGGLASSGEWLYLLRFESYPEPSSSLSPVGVITLSLPERWRGPPSPSTSLRDEGLGILSVDGRRWYQVRLAADGANPAAAELLVVTFHEGALTTQSRPFVLDQANIREKVPATASTLPLPMLADYHSLLLSPDGGTLYVIDYYAQAILVVDAIHPAVIQSVTYGRERFKRPLCAADLSPRGDRLYVLGNTGNHGDGILAFETSTRKLVGHFLPNEDLFCFTVSAGGDRVYALTLPSSPVVDPQLVTVDVLNGDEVRRVPLEIDEDCCGGIAAAVSSMDGVPALGRDGVPNARRRS